MAFLPKIWALIMMATGFFFFTFDGIIEPLIGLMLLFIGAMMLTLPR